MSSPRLSVVRFLGAALAVASVLAIVGCATDGSTPESAASGPAGPTVKVHFDSQTPAAMIVNGKDLGVTPVDANLEVDDAGFLKYNVKMTWDYSKAMGARTNDSRKNTVKNTELSWPTGKLVPQKVTVINDRVTEARESAPKNPPGTKSSVQRDD